MKKEQIQKMSQMLECKELISHVISNCRKRDKKLGFANGNRMISSTPLFRVIEANDCCDDIYIDDEVLNDLILDVLQLRLKELSDEIERL